MANENKIDFGEFLEGWDVIKDMQSEFAKLSKEIKTMEENISSAAKKTSDSLKDVSGATEDGREQTVKAVKSTQDLTKAQEALTEAENKRSDLQQAMTKIQRENYEAEKKYAEAREQSKRSELERVETLRLLREEMAKDQAHRKLIATIKEEAAENSAAVGSLDRLTATYKKQKKELAALSKSQRESAKSQALMESTAKLKEEIRLLNIELENSVEVNESYLDSISSMPGPIGFMISGVKNLGTSLVTLMANPIVALIAVVVGAIVGLVAGMKRTIEGQDRLNRVMLTGKAIFDAVLDVLGQFGVAIFDTLPKYMKRFTNDWKIMYTDVLAGVKAVAIATKEFFGADATELKAEYDELIAKSKELKKDNKELAKEINAAFEEPVEAAKRLREQVDENAEAAQKHQDVLTALLREQLSYIVENAQMQADADKARAKSEEMRRSDALASLDQLELSYGLRQKILDNEISLANKEAEAAAYQMSYNKNDVQYQREHLEAQARVIALNGQKFALETEGWRQMNRVRTQALTQEKKRAAATIAISRALSAQLRRVNEEIVEDADIHAHERIQAAQDNAVLLQQYAEDTYLAERKVREESLKIALATEADTKQQLDMLDAEYNDKKLRAEKELSTVIYKIWRTDLDRKIQLIEEEFELKSKRVNFERDLQNILISIMNVSSEKQRALMLRNDKAAMAERLAALEEAQRQYMAIRLSFVNPKNKFDPKIVEDMEAIRMEIALLVAEMAKADKDLSKINLNIWDALGINMDDDMREGLTSSLEFALGQMQEFLDAKIKMADEAVKATEREMSAAQRMMDYELTARANGYASNVEYARKNMVLAEQQNRAAVREKEKLQKAQERIQMAEQATSLITATALIWSQLGNPLIAIPAIALMWGSFAAAKIQAAKATKSSSEEYGDGHVELLSGGSHASGNDIDLGVKSDGTRRRAEGGEFFAVINRKSSKRFGKHIPGIINSLNDGSFPDKAPPPILAIPP